MSKCQFRKYFILAFFIYFISIQLYSQEDESKFDNIFYQLASEFSKTEPDLVLTRVDSLYENSYNTNLKVRSLMLKALLYSRLGDRNSAIRYAESAELLALETKNHDWRVRALGFIASQYQSLGFFEESDVYISRAEKGLTAIQNIDSYNIYLSNLLDSKSINAYVEGNYEESLRYLIESDSLKDIIPNFSDRDYFKTASEAIKGRLYFQLEKYELSELAYLNCKELLDSIGDKSNPLHGEVYTGLGNLAFVKGMDSATVWGYYEKAIKMTNEISDIDASMFLYENLLEFFASEKDWEQYYIYNEKLVEQYNIVHGSKNEVVLTAFDRLAYSQLTTKSLKTLSYSLIIVFSCILLGLIFYFKKKKQKNRLKFKSIISVLEKKVEELEDKDDKKREKAVHTDNGSDVKDDSNNTIKPKIPPETEMRILNKIKEFEDKLLFLDSGASLTYLANYCESNTKYVSSILKNTKEKDYSGYINEQRIYYIMHKLKEDTIYRFYKISYLAEVTGFSSHSVFSSVFKSVAGLSPSEFIYYLNEDKVAD